MNEITEQLEAATAAARAAVTVDEVPALGDDALVAAMAAIENLGRTVDALRVAVAAEAAERSRRVLGSDRLSAKHGCRTAYELIARVTQVAERTAVQRCRIGAGVRGRHALTGEVLPPRFPAVAEAVGAGQVGVDAVSAIMSALSPVENRAEPVLLEAAERALVGCVLGVDTATGERVTPFTADQTRVQALQWQVALDPDGVAPREAAAMLQRGFSKTGTRGEVSVYRLAAIPELAGRLDRLLDAFLSPKTTGRFLTPEQHAEALVSGDTRSPAQQRHDALISILDAASRSADMPTIGGAAPTVLVSVSADELEAGTGAGWIDGVEEPVSLGTVKQFICTGGVQKGYFTPGGRLIALGSPERGFTPQQRRGISLRDGGCTIPGCTIPAGWCEIHHVQEWSRGGPTHTDNGVLLCWYHHHTIDTSGWQITIRNGIPYVRPPVWIDQTRQWRRTTKSRPLTPPGKKTTGAVMRT
ncbi:DUF222 domain-containing protein [Rathayibacter sp. KR2-224]|uniref:HNH endonuclease signature motif containing protein n=1 Tax=Rathayibacter sp. KR2-224 TaxID=3400913 RepID=UPI003C0E943E